MALAAWCLLVVMPHATPDVDELVRQLDADTFAARRSASQQLMERGDAVFDQLVKAAQSRSAEVQHRCLEILESQLEKWRSKRARIGKERFGGTRVNRHDSGATGEVESPPQVQRPIRCATDASDPDHAGSADANATDADPAPGEQCRRHQASDGLLRRKEVGENRDRRPKDRNVDHAEEQGRQAGNKELQSQG